MVWWIICRVIGFLSLSSRALFVVLSQKQGNLGHVGCSLFSSWWHITSPSINGETTSMVCERTDLDSWNGFSLITTYLIIFPWKHKTPHIFAEIRKRKLLNLRFPLIWMILPKSIYLRRVQSSNKTEILEHVGKLFTTISKIILYS